VDEGRTGGALGFSVRIAGILLVWKTRNLASCCFQYVKCPSAAKRSHHDQAGVHVVVAPARPIRAGGGGLELSISLVTAVFGRLMAVTLWHPLPVAPRALLFVRNTADAIVALTDEFSGRRFEMVIFDRRKDVHQDSVVGTGRQYGTGARSGQLCSARTQAPQMPHVRQSAISDRAFRDLVNQAHGSG